MEVLKFMMSEGEESLEEAITVSKKGKRELRSIHSRGRFALLEYRDPMTKEKTENKFKLVLLHENGEVDEYFIIPLKQANRFLLLKEKKVKGPKVKAWNPKTGRLEEVIP